MKWWNVLLAAIVAIVLGTAPFIAQVVESQPLSVVEAQLKYQNGAPVAYQPVVIEFAGSPTWASWFGKHHTTVKALTDEKGIFQVIDLPAGKTYSVKALKPGSQIIPIGFFDTPSHGYQKIDVSDRLNRIMDEVSQTPLPH
jgi:hypothetical protein